jgi:hypothetical protein
MSWWNGLNPDAQDRIIRYAIVAAMLLFVFLCFKAGR